MNVKELASLVDGKVIGDESIVLHGASKIEEAKSGEFSFLSNPNYIKFLDTTFASAVIISNKIELNKFSKLPPALIVVKDPYTSFVIAIEKFQKFVPLLADGINSSAMISKSASVGKNCKIGANVFIDEDCKIGDNTSIMHNVVIEKNVSVDEDTLIFENVTIREGCKIGKRVILNPGCVIGSDGFGWASKEDGSYRKIPQLGIVVLEDDISIGANCCIDRATLGETRIKRGTKLDNLVHIGHNVIINEDTVIAGLTGISGSSKIGKQVKMGGQVGISGHLTIADNTTIGGASVVLSSIEKSGETYSGFPARPLFQTKRIEASLNQLPEILKTINNLEKKIVELENLLKKNNEAK
ncbi:MAG: UDP-3-O-(3-hydroxymyristoyl)glucosamine N-acyltransferase [Bacteroidota bacterium]